MLIAFAQDVLRPAGRTANNVLRANSEARTLADGAPATNVGITDRSGSFGTPGNSSSRRTS